MVARPEEGHCAARARAKASDKAGPKNCPLDISRKIDTPRLNMTTLEKRRERGDMLEVFKILKGLDRVNLEGNFLKLESNYLGQRTRVHSMKLVKPQHRTWKQNQFFASRVVNTWNNLPEKVVSSRTVNSFKHNYDQNLTMTRRQPL